MFNLKCTYNKAVNYLHNYKAKLLTVATLLYMNCYMTLNNEIMPAFAKGEGSGNSSYTPEGPKVSAGGTVTFGNNSGDLVAKAGPAIAKIVPVLGVIFGVGGLLLIAYGIWNALKASRDVSKADQTGFSRLGFAAIGPIVGGAVAVIISVVFGWGALFGQKVFSGGN